MSGLSFHPMPGIGPARPLVHYKRVASIDAALSLHPDRLLPPEREEPAIARRLEEARDVPVIPPHGHADLRVPLDNGPFPDPATLFVTPDHYVTRLLHADGVALDALGVGQGSLSEDASRAVCTTGAFCERQTADRRATRLLACLMRPSSTRRSGTARSVLIACSASSSSSSTSAAPVRFSPSARSASGAASARRGERTGSGENRI
jgi:hypothetical protein